MRTHTKSHDQRSPFDLLTELAVEGSSSLVEAQRTLLGLAQQENEILLNGVKERISGFVPGVAMADLVRRSVDTLIEVQQELLTTTSKQTLAWLESEKAGKSDRSAHLLEFAREGVEAFARAQKKFLEALAQEAAKASGGKHEQGSKPVKKTEITHLAREAGNAFIEAQKRLLDVLGQQMNVNFDLATESLGMVSPSRLLPVASITNEEVKNFFKTESSLIGSLVKSQKPKAVGRTKHGRKHTRKEEAVAV